MSPGYSMSVQRRHPPTVLSCPRMDHVKLADATYERTDLARKDAAGTEAEATALEMDVVDLIVAGASLTQVAKHFKIDRETARDHYTAGLERLMDTSIDRSIALREEVTARQRELILANMARAKAGDRASALIVQGADNLLASIWGLRSLRVERPHVRRSDGALSDALDAYLSGILEATATDR
jgi:DNA-binding CsgD family transcriptional regulator